MNLERMNDMQPNKIVNQLRIKYPVGARVRLMKMADIQAPPLGTKGSVLGVDDIGSIRVAWDNGSHLNVIYGEDSCERVVDEVLKSQIEKVRQTGQTNMFDARTVQRIADEMNLCKLVIFIEEEEQEYFNFILYGK
ncbi:DUF4314 domain-containing protein [Aerococcaceae bacterium NML191219]|nr:DUF4314 domain-containing protein [Aerococcaceae bacterium NML191219]